MDFSSLTITYIPLIIMAPWGLADVVIHTIPDNWIEHRILTHRCFTLKHQFAGHLCQSESRLEQKCIRAGEIGADKNSLRCLSFFFRKERCSPLVSFMFGCPCFPWFYQLLLILSFAWYGLPGKLGFDSLFFFFQGFCFHDH